MRRRKFANSLPIVVTLALAGYPCSAGAAVIIKTFQVSICVTGPKHPDVCKNAGANAQFVVSEDQMESLESQVGQAASIMAFPAKGGSPPASRQDRHQRHHQDQDSQ
jgi:hypothetical protein